MNVNDSGKFREQNSILSKLFEAGLRPNELKAKLRNGPEYRSHQHTCNHGGGKGKAARRDGWLGNGSSRATVKFLKAYERGLR